MLELGVYNPKVHFPADPRPELENLAWFAIHVRSKCETLTQEELRYRGFEVFLPTHRVKRRWSDRVKMLDLPLFPGYLFSRFDLSGRFRVLNSPGVAQIVGFGATPVPISESEIRSVQALVASKAALVPWPYLHAGQRVRVDYGPLAGVEGIVTRAEDGKPRVVVSVTLLQRSIAAEIDRDCIGHIQ
jgi:transcription antitermination factor NusG